MRLAWPNRNCLATSQNATYTPPRHFRVYDTPIRHGFWSNIV